MSAIDNFYVVMIVGPAVRKLYPGVKFEIEDKGGWMDVTLYLAEGVKVVRDTEILKQAEVRQIGSPNLPL